MYILIPISLFIVVFGIFYLFLSTRNRERLALIEKGVDATVFFNGRPRGTVLFRMTILNIGLVLIGIGLGIFIPLLLLAYTAIENNGLYPAFIFLMSGIALLVGFRLTKNIKE